jgi:hypothetical protein
MAPATARAPPAGRASGGGGGSYGTKGTNGAWAASGNAYGVVPLDRLFLGSSGGDAGSVSYTDPGAVPAARYHAPSIWQVPPDREAAGSSGSRVKRSISVGRSHPTVKEARHQLLQRRILMGITVFQRQRGGRRREHSY